MLSVAIGHRFTEFSLDASFVAPQGVTALFGQSGSGKTTIVNAVAGLMRPDTGRIKVDGLVLSDSETGYFLPPHRRKIGYVFQEARLFPHLTVRQNLLYGWFFAGRPSDAGFFDRIVDMLGIGHLLTRRPAALSGGERQRVALGRALLARPRLLLMDEPLAALDETRKAEIMPYLERLRDEGGVPILYVSHSPGEIARLATTVVLIESGRVITAGPTPEILSDPATAPMLGLRETGAIITARVEAHENDGLTRLTISAGMVYLPTINAVPGTVLRLRILAHDVMLALKNPTGISALNTLPALIRDITDTDSGALVRLDIGDETILSRVTWRSVNALGLSPGKQVYAVLKAVSVAPGNLGTQPADSIVHDT